MCKPQNQEDGMTAAENVGECVYVCVCAHVCLWRPEEGVESPRTRVTGHLALSTRNQTWVLWTSNK